MGQVMKYIEVTEVRCSEKQAPPIYVESDEDDIKS